MLKLKTFFRDIKWLYHTSYSKKFFEDEQGEIELPSKQKRGSEGVKYCR